MKNEKWKNEKAIILTFNNHPYQKEKKESYNPSRIRPAPENHRRSRLHQGHFGSKWQEKDHLCGHSFKDFTTWLFSLVIHFFGLIASLLHFLILSWLKSLNYYDEELASCPLFLFLFLFSLFSFLFSLRNLNQWRISGFPDGIYIILMKYLEFWRISPPNPCHDDLSKTFLIMKLTSTTVLWQLWPSPSWTSLSIPPPAAVI